MTSTIHYQPKTSLDPRTVLIEASVVRALTGLRPDQIRDRVDGADLLHAPLLWVFDFSSVFEQSRDREGASSPRRDRRFWRVEIESPISLLRGPDTLAAVINKILPPARHHFHSGELLQMFALSRPSLQKLRPDLGGRLQGPRNCFFDRAAVADFLKTRWLGNLKSTSPK